MQSADNRRSRPGHLRPVAPIQREDLSPGARRFLWVFSVTLVLVAGSAFIMKLIEFYATATTQGADALASFLIPVLNYLLVAAGFFGMPEKLPIRGSIAERGAAVQGDPPS